MLAYSTRVDGPLHFCMNVVLFRVRTAFLFSPKGPGAHSCKGGKRFFFLTMVFFSEASRGAGTSIQLQIPRNTRKLLFLTRKVLAFCAVPNIWVDALLTPLLFRVLTSPGRTFSFTKHTTVRIELLLTSK